jgi:hypothetical protein
MDQVHGSSSRVHDIVKHSEPSNRRWGAEIRSTKGYALNKIWSIENRMVGWDFEVWIYSGPLVTRWMGVILINQRGTPSSNHGHCFGDEQLSTAPGSRWWSTLAAGGAIGGAHRKRVEEGRRGSNLIEIGSYGGGTARRTHLGAPWV